MGKKEITIQNKKAIKDIKDLETLSLKVQTLSKFLQDYKDDVSSEIQDNAIGEILFAFRELEDHLTTMGPLLNQTLQNYKETSENFTENLKNSITSTQLMLLKMRDLKDALNSRFDMDNDQIIYGNRVFKKDFYQEISSKFQEIFQIYRDVNTKGSYEEEKKDLPELINIKGEENLSDSVLEEEESGSVLEEEESGSVLEEEESQKNSLEEAQQKKEQGFVWELTSNLYELKHVLIDYHNNIQLTRKSDVRVTDYLNDIGVFDSMKPVQESISLCNHLLTSLNHSAEITRDIGKQYRDLCTKMTIIEADRVVHSNSIDSLKFRDSTIEQDPSFKKAQQILQKAAPIHEFNLRMTVKQAQITEVLSKKKNDISKRNNVNFSHSSALSFEEAMRPYNPHYVSEFKRLVEEMKSTDPFYSKGSPAYQEFRNSLDNWVTLLEKNRLGDFNRIFNKVMDQLEEKANLYRDTHNKGPLVDRQARRLKIMNRFSQLRESYARKVEYPGEEYEHKLAEKVLHASLIAHRDNPEQFKVLHDPKLFSQKLEVFVESNYFQQQILPLCRDDLKTAVCTNGQKLFEELTKALKKPYQPKEKKMDLYEQIDDEIQNTL